MLTKVYPTRYVIWCTTLKGKYNHKPQPPDTIGVSIHPSIHCSMGSAPVGVQCPLTSSLGEFPGYWDWLWYPGLSPVLVSNAFPFAFHIWVFFHSLYRRIGCSIIVQLFHRGCNTHLNKISGHRIKISVAGRSYRINMVRKNCLLLT